MHRQARNPFRRETATLLRLCRSALHAGSAALAPLADVQLCTDNLTFALNNDAPDLRNVGERIVRIRFVLGFAVFRRGDTARTYDGLAEQLVRMGVAVREERQREHRNRGIRKRLEQVWTAIGVHQ